MLEELAQDILDIGMNASAAKANRLSVRLIEDAGADRLTILMADNGNGMSPELRRRVLNGFATTKTGGTKPLGLGIAMLRQAADLCDGRFRLYSREDVGTFVVASMRHSHIDRPPLGDIAASITALCCSDSGMGVRFEHRCGETVFRFDSTDVLNSRQRNQGIPASSLLKIDNLLREGERALRECCPDSVTV
ncbi:MAG: ATP-binding protein [bacterium]